MYSSRLMGPAHDGPLSSHGSLRWCGVASARTTSSFVMVMFSVGAASVGMAVVYRRGPGDFSSKSLGVEGFAAHGGAAVPVRWCKRTGAERGENRQPGRAGLSAVPVPPSESARPWFFMCPKSGDVFRAKWGGNGVREKISFDRTLFRELSA